MASAVGFFVNPRISPQNLARVAIACAAAAVVAQVAAGRLHDAATAASQYSAVSGREGV